MKLKVTSILIDGIIIVFSVAVCLMAYTILAPRSAHQSSEFEATQLKSDIEELKKVSELGSLDQNWRQAEMLAAYMGVELVYDEEESLRDPNRGPHDAWYGRLSGNDSLAVSSAAWLLHRTRTVKPVAARFENGKAVITIAVLGVLDSERNQ